MQDKYNLSSVSNAKKSLPEGKWIMSETSFTKFPASSIDLKFGIPWTTSETDD